MSRIGRSRPVAWIDNVAASPIDMALSGMVLVVLGVVGMIWGAALGSSRLVNGEAAEVGVNDAAIAAVRFGRNWFRWDGVWPAEIDRALAGPIWFWLIFAAETVLIGLAFWPLWRLLGPRPTDPLPVFIEPTPVKHPRAAKRIARQARKDEQRATRMVATEPAPPISSVPGVDKLLVDSASRGRLVLGRHGNKLVATEKHHSVIVFGPTQSGKTSGLTAPAILEWDGPALVTSSKADLISLAWPERAKMNGRTWLFDPTSSMSPPDGPDSVGPRGGNGWSPLHLITAVPQPRTASQLDRRIQQWGLARRTAQWMVSATRTGPATDLPEPWYVAAEQFLAPMLLAAAAEEMPISQVAEWAERRDDDAVTVVLERIEVPEALAAWEGGHNFDAPAQAGSYQILAMALYPFGDPVVLSQTRSADINARGLLDGHANTLFLLSPPNHEDRLRPLLTTLVSEVVDSAISMATSSPTGRLAKPLLVVLDDSAGSAPLRLLDQLASAGAGLGIQLLTIFQDLGQVQRRFGRHEAVQLANDHRARVILPGISDGATLDYVNSIIRGNRLVDHGSQVIDLTDDEQIVAGSPTWMRTLDDGDALCVYGNLPPLRMALRPWYADQALNERIRPTPPKQRWFARSVKEDALIGGGFPNPLDSDGNDSEAARYWEQVQKDGTLPHARGYDDGSDSDSFESADPLD